MEMRAIFLIIMTLGVCTAFPADDEKPADRGSFPFLVSINLTLFDDEFCSGSIINEKWILTTAICATIGQSVSDLVIWLENGGITYNISRVVVPTKFNASTHGSDIALLKIDGSFVFSDIIQPIELGDVSVNDTVVEVGWGRATVDGQSLMILQYTDLSVLSNEECMKQRQDIVIKSGEVCALGGPRMSSCEGDLAAPLIHKGTLVGIRSWSIKDCSDKSLVHVFTRVSVFQDWINEIIRES